MKFRKNLSIALITLHLVTQLMITPAVFAEDLSTTSAPSAPPAPSAPQTPSSTSAPEPTSAPTTPTQESNDAKKQEEEKQKAEQEANEQAAKDARRAERKAQEAAAVKAAAEAAAQKPNVTPASSNTPSAQSTATPTNQSGKQNDSGNSGKTDLKTGDANANIAGFAVANTNTSATPATNTGPSASISNEGNGSNSTNNNSASIVNNNNTNQQNSAQVSNNVSAAADSGNNTASKNLGDTNIETGDANVAGTLITAVNTNVDGVAVSEFNINDDHKGDIILDFGAACVSGCGQGSANLANTNNGKGSNNTTNYDSETNNNTFQSNDASIENGMVLTADSGNNDASKNTGGDTTIKTGDANIAANALTFANNNISGNVVFAMVNIFGDLIGDILMPEDAIKNTGTACGSNCGQDLNVVNSGNGSESTNSANIALNNNDNTFQSNTADIENNIILEAQTGNNETSENTGGNSTIKTGKATVDANVLNIANSNVSGDGTWWLVIVNEAGNWIGKIVGGNGSNMAGSEGTDFNVNENGEITASNNGNGSGSTNETNISQNTNNNVNQTNNTKLVNNMDLSGNTGGNTASQNTGGNSDIKTGDVNVIANMVNFVNNNITGNGKLIVTVINVFGSWLGDFVSPGQQKQPKPEALAQATPTPTIIPAQGAIQNEVEDDETTITSTNKKKTKKVTTIAQNGEESKVITTNKQNTSSTLSYTGSDEDVLATEIAQEEESKVLGQKIEAAETLTKKTIKINLAFIVLLLPLGLGVIAYIKRRNLVNALNEWSKTTRQWFF